MSDEFDIYGDADTGDVADAQGDGGPRVAGASGSAAAPTGAVSDGSPSVAVPGYPGLRAGVPGGDGVLGLSRDPVGRPPGDQGTIPGYQTVSWRDTDPEAINYDLYSAKRDLGEAQAIGSVLSPIGWGQWAAGIGAKRAPQLGLSEIAKSLGAIADPEVGAVAGALGSYMGKVEVPRLQNKINILQGRQKQFGGAA